MFSWEGKKFIAFSGLMKSHGSPGGVCSLEMGGE